MRIPRLIAAASFAALLAGPLHAETYEGVTPQVSARDRAVVRAEAVAATQQPNPYADGASARAEAPGGTADRMAVRAQAIEAAHARNQNVDRKAFFSSEVPTQYLN